jgi:hypothetical protein
MSDANDKAFAARYWAQAKIDMEIWRRRMGFADRLEEILADDAPVNSKPSAGANKG